MVQDVISDFEASAIQFASKLYIHYHKYLYLYSPMAITVPRPCSTEVLWGDLQKAVHDQKPTNLAQL